MGVCCRPYRFAFFMLPLPFPPPANPPPVRHPRIRSCQGFARISSSCVVAAQVDSHSGLTARIRARTRATSIVADLHGFGERFHAGNKTSPHLPLPSDASRSAATPIRYTVLYVDHMTVRCWRSCCRCCRRCRCEGVVMLAGCSDAGDGNGVAAGIIVTRTCPLWIDVQCVACGWSGGVGFRWELAKCVSGCVYDCSCMRDHRYR